MGLREMVNQPRTPGQHSRQKPAARTAKQIAQEEPPVSDQQMPANSDLLDDWFAAHLDAAAKAEHAKQQAIPLENESRHQRSESDKALNEAARLRGLLAEEEKKAEQAALLAQGAEARATEWRNHQKRQEARAAGHQDRIDEEVAKGAQHPRERQPGPGQAPQQPSVQPPSSHTALDGPSAAKPSHVTQPIPAVSPAQQQRAAS